VRGRGEWKMNLRIGWDVISQNQLRFVYGKLMEYIRREGCFCSESCSRIWRLTFRDSGV
jgi:hypothetical protein